MPPPGSLVRDKLAAMFLHQGLPQPSDIVETASLPMITALLEQGRMIVALPEVSVASYCKAGILECSWPTFPLASEDSVSSCAATTSCLQARA